MSNIIMKEAIEEYLSSKNKRMSNLYKAKTEQLKDLIVVYNIDIEAFKEKRQQMKKIERAEKKEHEKQQQLIFEERVKAKKQDDLKLSVLCRLVGILKRTELRDNWVRNEQDNDQQYMLDHMVVLKEAERRRDILLSKVQKSVGGEITKYGVCVNGINVGVGDFETFTPRSQKCLIRMYNELPHLEKYWATQSGSATPANTGFKGQSLLDELKATRELFTSDQLTDAKNKWILSQLKWDEQEFENFQPNEFNVFLQRPTREIVEASYAYMEISVLKEIRHTMNQALEDFKPKLKMRKN